MTPPAPTLPQRVDLLDGRVRQLEARYAQLIDRADIYGPPPPPPRRWPVPELTDDQVKNLALAAVIVIVLAVRTVYAYRRKVDA